MEKVDSALCQWTLLYTHFNFQFSCLPTFYKRNNIFKCSAIKGQINVPLWTHIRYKGQQKDGKTFIRCYIIALRS